MNLYAIQAIYRFEMARTFRTLTQGEEQRYGAQYQTVLLGAS